MYCPTENDALSIPKRRDSFRKPSEMKTQPELRVASCGLRPESYPQHTVEAIFIQNATRNLATLIKKEENKHLSEN